MPRPPDRRDFESARMKIRRGTLAITRRVRPGEAGPAEPDEIFDFDAKADAGQDPDPDPGQDQDGAAKPGTGTRWRLPDDGAAE